MRHILTSQPLPAWVRLSFFAISAFGAISSSGHSLLRDVAHRLDGSVPTVLLPAATWAAPAFAPFARMAAVLSSSAASLLLCMPARRSSVFSDLLPAGISSILPRASTAPKPSLMRLSAKDLPWARAR